MDVVDLDKLNYLHKQLCRKLNPHCISFLELFSEISNFQNNYNFRKVEICLQFITCISLFLHNLLPITLSIFLYVVFIIFMTLQKVIRPTKKLLLDFNFSTFSSVLIKYNMMGQ